MLIDKTKALELLERAVQEKGVDYVYPRRIITRSGDIPELCMYEKNGAPSCIVGHAYTYVGATIEQLRTMDKANDAAIDDLFVSSYERLPVPTTEDAIDVFQAAQYAQDLGDTWGEALQAARHVAERQ